MISLKDFLETADQDNQVALQQARDYTANQGKLIAATTVNSVLAELNMTGIVKDIANDPTHVARHKMASVILGIQGGEPFNFIQGTSRGDGVIAMLDWLADNVEAEHQPKIVMFKNVLVGMANGVVQPFANVTLHDVLIARNQCETSDNVQIVGRQAVIELAGEFEPHKPRLLAKNPATGQWQRINNFANADNSPCAVAGVYACIIPAQFSGWSLKADDPYGAVV